MYLKSVRALGWPENFKKRLTERKPWKDLEIPEDFVATAESALKPKELAVIHDRYKNHMSFTDIGMKYGISDERARQIANTAERRVRWKFWDMSHASSVEIRLSDDSEIDIRNMSVRDYFLDKEDPHILVQAGNALARTGVIHKSIKPEWPNRVWRSEEIHVETIRDVVDLIRTGDIKLVRNFGKKCLEAVVSQFLADGITKEELGLEEPERS